MRVTPNSFKALSLSLVMLSARPASTVNSFTWEKSKEALTFDSSLLSSSGSSVVGVPPPIYTLSRILSWQASLTKSISFSNAVRYSPTLSFQEKMGKEVKEQ